MRIRDKVTIPFIALAFAGIAVTALLSVDLISDALEQRFERQLLVASELLSRANFGRSPTILERVKMIIEADVLTFEAGKVVASTLDPSAESDWVPLLEKQLDSVPAAALQVPTVNYVDFGGRPFTLAYRPLDDGSDAVLVVLKETSDIARARRAITKPIAIVAIVMAVLISLISHLVTRGITRPLQELAAGSKRLAAGDWNAMVEIATRDEVGELSRALNEMAGELRRTEEKLLRSEKLSVTGSLAARVAHDIRNPLFSIKMRAQMICERLPPDSADRASLEPILKDIEHVEWVVQGLLDLASPVKLDLEASSANAVVEDVLASIGDQLEHGRIEIRRDLDPDLPQTWLDHGRVKQVLLNLVLNAAEAMPRGGILGARTGLGDDRRSVIVEIWDTGEGIDPDDMDKLFDPFFTTKREGVGLGLLNARSLVESHGGSLELLPREGGGARAVVRLPIQPEPEAPAGSLD